MANIKKVLGSLKSGPPISKTIFESNGFDCSAFEEYDVEYVVKDIESLIFWLNALDMLHSDLSGGDAIASVDVLNVILDGNVSSRGFITNEHRYLMVAQKID